MNKVRDELEKRETAWSKLLRRVGMLEDRMRELELRMDYGVEQKDVPDSYGGTD